jgi:hypothetical protein
MILNIKVLSFVSALLVLYTSGQTSHLAYKLHCILKNTLQNHILQKKTDFASGLLRTILSGTAEELG